VLDDGRLTDGQGRTVDFRNTLLILTSNLGSAYLVDPTLDAEKKQRVGDGVVRPAFKPEFLNRLDEVVLFDALSKDELATSSTSSSRCSSSGWRRAGSPSRSPTRPARG
jgi:ATP-dependent Clp protease ATP-binding subunit ClpB